mmetsp:Transcript_23271/g.45375  ORF Transcript_23271/g.45375 Transcript_23271/m.45375 type:complete len:101 (-) Transcript_23271:191-493(-)
MRECSVVGIIHTMFFFDECVPIIGPLCPASSCPQLEDAEDALGKRAKSEVRTCSNAHMNAFRAAADGTPQCNQARLAPMCDTSCTAYAMLYAFVATARSH